MERRWGKRLVIDEVVRVDRSDGHSSHACLHEVSLSGARLLGDVTIPTMTRVWLEIPGPQPNGRAHHLVEAFVVRSSWRGIGLEWCEFAPPGIISLIAQWQPERHTPRRVPTTLLG